MPKFDRIEDPRQRLEARLNYALRARDPAEMGHIMVEELIKPQGGSWAIWDDLTRQFIAKYLIAVIEDEFGVDLAAALTAASR